MWKPEIPPPEVVAAAFPEGVFDPALDAMHSLFFLDVRDETGELDSIGLYVPEEELEELRLIWGRLREDRLTGIEASRRRYDLQAESKVSMIGTGEDPALDAAWRDERDAELALGLDHKSLYVFGDLLLAAYVRMSQRVWQAPEGIPHNEGATKFIKAARKRMAAPDFDAASVFAEYMAILLDPLEAVDDLLGFYRDKFIVHLPEGMFVSGSGGAIAVPLVFEWTHSRKRGEPTPDELRALGKTLNKVAVMEKLDLGPTDMADPRIKLRTLLTRVPDLQLKESVTTVQNLLREWGASSPPVLMVAQRLAEVLELWAVALVRKVGLMAD